MSERVAVAISSIDLLTLERTNMDPESVLQTVERLFDLDRSTDVERVCTSSISEFPDRFEFFYHRAQARAILGKIALAIEDVSAAIKLNPGEPALFYFRGIWRIEVGLFREAVEDFAQTIRGEQALGGAYYGRSACLASGVGHLLSGNLREAASCVEGLGEGAGIYLRGRMWEVHHLKGDGS